MSQCCSLLSVGRLGRLCAGLGCAAALPLCGQGCLCLLQPAAQFLCLGQQRRSPCPVAARRQSRDHTQRASRAGALKPRTSGQPPSHLRASASDRCASIACCSSAQRTRAARCSAGGMNRCEEADPSTPTQHTRAGIHTHGMAHLPGCAPPPAPPPAAWQRPAAAGRRRRRALPQPVPRGLAGVPGGCPRPAGGPAAAARAQRQTARRPAAARALLRRRESERQCHRLKRGWPAWWRRVRCAGPLLLARARGPPLPWPGPCVRPGPTAAAGAALPRAFGGSARTAGTLPGLWWGHRRGGQRGSGPPDYSATPEKQVRAHQ